VIAFVTYPTYPTFAIEAAGLGVTLDAIAEKLERAAAKQARKRVAEPQVHRRVVARTSSGSTTTATVRLAASVAAEGGVQLLPTVKLDNSAAIAALGSLAAAPFMKSNFDALRALTADSALRANMAAMTQIAANIAPRIASINKMVADTIKIQATIAPQVEAFQKAYAAQIYDTFRILERYGFLTKPPVEDA
jgi:hypothetical protein